MNTTTTSVPQIPPPLLGFSKEQLPRTSKSMPHTIPINIWVQPQLLPSSSFCREVQEFPSGAFGSAVHLEFHRGTALGAVWSSRVHQVMWSSHITHANKTLNHNCSDPGHRCTLPLGYEIQLITCRACCR